MKYRALIAMLCFLLAMEFAFGILLPSACAEETVWYVENGWNYVDGSVDVSGGIPDDATGTLGQIRRRGELRVAVDPTHPPQVFEIPGKTGENGFDGADIQLARLIAEKMRVSLKLVPLESIYILPSLTEEQCDLAISALSFTPGRALSYTMSKGYYYPDEEIPIGILVRAESGISSLDDLEDTVLIVQSNSLPETMGVKQIRNYREFRRISSAHAVYEEVRKGTADAGIVKVKTAERYLQNNPDCGLCLVEGITFHPEEQYLGNRIAARKGETQLICFVNGVIDIILEDGRYETWMREAAERAAESGL